MIFSKQNILLDQTFKTQNDLFAAVSEIALKNKVIKSKDLLINAFLNREAVGTTGFEDGFAIPHARSSVVLEPTVFVVRNKVNFENWDAFDGKGVRIAILLLIPEAAGSYHIDVLSTFAAKLMNPDFRNALKTSQAKQIYELINDLLIEIKTKSEKITEQQTKVYSKSQDREFLIGISACPAGIAHTFMVKEKMEQLAKDHNLEIKWETQGANGQKNTLTHADIKRANYIIIASDIELDLSRFKDAKIYKTTTNNVIKNAPQVFKTAKTYITSDSDSKDLLHNFKNYSNKLLMAFKSSFGTPWFYFSVTATLLGLVSLIGFATYGAEWRNYPALKNLDLFKMQLLASIALYFAMPLVGASVAEKLTKQKGAFYIVLLAGIILNLPHFGKAFNAINGFDESKVIGKSLFYEWNGAFRNFHLQTGANVIGMLVLTIFISFVINQINHFKQKLQAHKNQVWKWIGNNLSPWITVTLPAALALFLIVFLLGAPLSFLSYQVIEGLIIYPNNHWWLRFIIGAIFGMLIAYDLGGTVNKITIIILVGLAQYDLRIGAIIPIAIPAASLGLGFTYFFNKNNFKDEDQKETAQSFRRALNGMSEGPLLLTNKYGKRVKTINLLTTGLASGLIYVLGIYIFKGGLGGILVMGAQAHLATSNDVSFLNDLLPLGQGFVTFICATLYGIIAYYLVMTVSALSYVLMAQIVFRINYNGKRVFK